MQTLRPKPTTPRGFSKYSYTYGRTPPSDESAGVLLGLFNEGVGIWGCRALGVYGLVSG